MHRCSFVDKSYHITTIIDKRIFFLLSLSMITFERIFVLVSMLGTTLVASKVSDVDFHPKKKKE